MNTRILDTAAAITNRRKIRIANWAADFVAQHDHLYQAVMAKAGAIIAVTEDGWTATSPNAPWSK